VAGCWIDGGGGLYKIFLIASCALFLTFGLSSIANIIIIWKILFAVSVDQITESCAIKICSKQPITDLVSGACDWYLSKTVESITEISLNLTFKIDVVSLNFKKYLIYLFSKKK